MIFLTNWMKTGVAQIISLVDDDHFGQIFISDTHPERTEAIVKQIHQSYKIFKL
jgi:DNA replication and repair protein RecF